MQHLFAATTILHFGLFCAKTQNPDFEIFRVCQNQAETGAQVRRLQTNGFSRQLRCIRKFLPKISIFLRVEKFSARIEISNF